MKMWLINIGKAWSVLRRDGVFRGVKRIFEGLWSLLPRKIEGDILIVTSGVGDSARYRGRHVAEELEAQGFHVAVTTQYDPRLSRYADTFSVIVFHRTLFQGSVKKLFDRAKELERSIVFETDDLVYEPTFVTQTDFYQKMNALEKKLYEHGVGGEILNDPFVRVCTTTTSYLADRLREKGKEVFIVRNKLCKQDVEWAEEILKNSKLRMTNDEQEGVVRIGYFSGTATHNKDFETITDALLQIFQSHPFVRLVLAGPLELDKRFHPFSDRIDRLSFADRKKHFENIASVDINLAPLVIGDPFCESKSELKWYEAGLLAVPTLASATRNFREVIHDGQDGFVAGETSEWVSKLSLLVEDTDLRIRMGELARTRVLREYATLSGGSESYYKYLRSNIPKV